MAGLMIKVLLTVNGSNFREDNFCGDKSCVDTLSPDTGLTVSEFRCKDPVELKA